MKHILKLILLLLLVSCVNNQGSNISHQQKRSSINRQNQEKPPLPDGWEYGKISEVQGSDKTEINLLSQLNTYNKALLRGDIDNAKIYLYSDAIRYFRKYYTKLGDDEIAEEFFKSVSDEYQATIQVLEEKGVIVELLPISLIKKISDGNNLIYLIDTSLTAYNEKVSIYTSPETILGISINQGKNWTFITRNSDSPNILRFRFNENVINQIMEY